MSSAVRPVLALTLALAVIAVLAGIAILAYSLLRPDDPVVAPPLDPAPSRPSADEAIESDGSRAPSRPVEPRPDRTSATKNPAAPAAAPDGLDLPFIPDDRPTGTVVGRVTGPGHRPLADADLRMRRRERSALGMHDEGPVVAVGRSGADGSFELERVPPGRDYRLEARHARHAPAALARIRVPPGGETDVGTITLPAGAILRGRVRSRKLGLLAGATVRVVNDASPEALGDPVSVSTTTGEGGAFRFDGLAAGKVRIEAAAAGHAPTHVMRTLRSGQELGNLEILIDRGLTVRGDTVDDRGEAIAGARVTASGQGHHAYAVTDARGQFEVQHLRAGRYQLAAAKHGYRDPAGRNAPTEVAAGQTGIRLLLERCAVVLGTVQDARTRAPVTDFSVAWGPPGGRPENGRAFQNDEGRFQVDELPAGRLVIEISSPRHVSASLPVIRLTPGGRMELAPVLLGPGGIVTGRVLDGRSRKPVPGARIAVRRALPTDGVVIDSRVLEELKPLRSAQTDTTGRFVIRSLAGSFVLSVEHPAYAVLRMADVEFPKEGQRDLGDLVLTGGGSIAGLVRGKAGKGRAAAEVWIHNEKAGFSRHVRTDRGGRFELRRLPPGEYRVQVTRRGGTISVEDLIEMARAGTRTVVVVDGRETVVEL